MKAMFFTFHLFLLPKPPGQNIAQSAMPEQIQKGLVITMEVDLIFKIAAIGIIVAVLNQLLIRSGREEQAMMTTLAGLIVVLMMIINEISDLFNTVKSIFGLW